MKPRRYRHKLTREIVEAVQLPRVTGRVTSPDNGFCEAIDIATWCAGDFFYIGGSDYYVRVRSLGKVFMRATAGAWIVSWSDGLFTVIHDFPFHRDFRRLVWWRLFL